MKQFLERYKNWGHEVNVSGLNLKKSIRINSLKISKKEFVKRFKKKLSLEKVEFTDFGYYCAADFSLASTPEYLKGYYYIQEAASMLSVQVLDIQRDETILDMCAAPGSKTTQIAQYLSGTGTIIAIDKSKARLTALKNNIERCSINNAILYQMNAVQLSELNMKFDKILLDAPCSGNFAIDNGWFQKRDIAGIVSNSRTQKRLLETAISLLNPKGILVYSTCSLEKEEDEDVIEWALDTFDIKLNEINLKIGSAGLTEKTKKCKRLWPDLTNTQGFFIASISLKQKE